MNQKVDRYMMRGWMDRRTGGWMDEQMMSGWVGGWMCECLDGRLDQQIDG